MTLFNGIFLTQYFLLNGFLVHRFFLKEKDSGTLETFLSSLFISVCLNSIVIYLLSRTFHMPITIATVIITSFAITAGITAIGKIAHKKA